MKPPEAFREHLKDGEKELQEEKDKHQQSVNSHIAARRNNAERNKKRSWEHFQFDAKLDLGGKLSEYVNWKIPDNWRPEKNIHWLYIRIPGLNTIVVEYRKHENEWYHDHWGVCCNGYQGGLLVSFWKIFYREEKSLQYVLALAREQFLIQSKTERTEVVIEEIEEAS